MADSTVVIVKCERTWLLWNKMEQKYMYEMILVPEESEVTSKWNGNVNVAALIYEKWSDMKL